MLDNLWKLYLQYKLFSKYVIKQFCSKNIPVCSTTLSSKITMVLQGAFPPTSYLDSFLNGLFNLQSTGFQNPKKESFTSIVAHKLTVGLPEIWNILEIQKMKICSEVRNFIGKMNFWSKYAEVSWLLRYSVFSVFTKISWPIFPSKLRKNRAGCNFFGDIPGFGLLHRFQKWSNFWKSIIQQLTYEQYAV